ncbi:MAG: cytochrome b/b6 domain-containing protein [Deltaproteobacteria bacterium]
MPVTGYSRVQISLHWLMLLLLGFNWLFSDPMEQAYRTLERGGALVSTPWLHIIVGIAVLAFVLLRLAIRLTRGVPAESEAAPPLMRLAGRIGHWVLYGLMLAIPVLGLMAWYLGIEAADELHGLAVDLLVIVVVLHILAALFHQYVLKDGLLKRMMRAA